MNGLSRTIIALDNMSKEELFAFLDSLPKMPALIKIGLELFCKYGPSIINEIYERYRVEIFLDLKLHDIPNTVYKTIHSLKGLPLKFLTIHLSGGPLMIQQAIKAKEEVLPKTKLLGVSYLTSLKEEDFRELWGVNKDQIQSSYQRIFTLALKSEIDGIVLSANELTLLDKLEKNSHHKLIRVTPGIRFQDEIESNSIHDQARVMGPEQALKRGSSFLVMGRSLTQSSFINKRIIELEEITI